MYILKKTSSLLYLQSTVDGDRREIGRRVTRTYVHGRTKKPKIRNLKSSVYIRFRLTDGMRFENILGELTDR